MNEQLPKLKPVSILLTTYNRLSFLKKAINLINERTLYPYRLIVVSNHCTDGTLQYLKESKVLGRIWDYLYLDSNVGQSVALNRGVALVNDWEKNKRRPSSDFIVTTNEDISPPKLFIDGKGCWLEKMIYLFEKHESEGLGALAMRKTPHEIPHIPPMFHHNEKLSFINFSGGSYEKLIFTFYYISFNTIYYTCTNTLDERYA